ncbi:hypothetical protein M2281_004466 [Mesorhizobium soli]|uniref:hypothetical protein n=1 Tax=Pseudaminobacter soli (ex Li et al. 2025) TaxID=1295366 RepID=UPI002475EA80|nr:hypothetical protein [Mesorhizobium soli]MDH6233853.1 hypothetical protein [Mesorhizobium soli]
MDSARASDVLPTALEACPIARKSGDLKTLVFDEGYHRKKFFVWFGQFNHLIACCYDGRLPPDAA